MKLTEDNIEEFIRKNKDKFDRYYADNQHEERFLQKLSRRFKKFISIVPYLIRVLIMTIIIFTASIIIWNNYIRKDRHEISLKQKIWRVYESDKSSKMR